MMNKSQVTVSNSLDSNVASSKENIFHFGNLTRHDNSVIDNRISDYSIRYSKNILPNIPESSKDIYQKSSEVENKNYVPVYHTHRTTATDLAQQSPHNPNLQHLYLRMSQQAINNPITESSIVSSVNATTTPPLIIMPPSSLQFLNPISNESVGTGRKADQFFKTKMCIPFTTGLCRRGDCCSFAHGSHQLKRPLNLQKTRLCDLWLRGCCPHNDQCFYAHGHQELKSTDDYYKTGLCKYWKKGFVCQRGEECRHAHGQQELRTRVYRRTERDKQMLRALRQPSNRFSNEESTPGTSIHTSLSSEIENIPINSNNRYNNFDSEATTQASGGPIQVSLSYSRADSQKQLEKFGIFDASVTDVINKNTTGLYNNVENTKNNSKIDNNSLDNDNNSLDNDNNSLSNDGNNDLNNSVENSINNVQKNIDFNGYEKPILESKKKNDTTYLVSSLDQNKTTKNSSELATECWEINNNASADFKTTQIEDNILYGSESCHPKMYDEMLNRKVYDQSSSMRYYGELHDSLAATSQRQYYTSNASILSLIHESYSGDNQLPLSSFGLSGYPAHIADNMILVNNDEQTARSVHNPDLAHIEQLSLISSQELFNPTEWLRHIPSAPSILMSTAMSAAANVSQKPLRTESIDSADTMKEFEDSILSQQTYVKEAELRNNKSSTKCATAFDKEKKNKVFSEPLLKILVSKNNNSQSAVNNDVNSLHPIIINDEPCVLASIILGEHVVTDLGLLSKLWSTHVMEQTSQSQQINNKSYVKPQVNSPKKRLKKKTNSYNDLSLLRHVERTLSSKKTFNSAADVLRLITELVFRGVGASSSSKPTLPRNVSTPILGQLEGSGPFNVHCLDAELFQSKNPDLFKPSSTEPSSTVEEKILDLLKYKA